MVSLFKIAKRNKLQIPKIFPPVAIATDKLPFLISAQSSYFVTISKMVRKTTSATTATAKNASVAKYGLLNKTSTSSFISSPAFLYTVERLQLHPLFPIYGSRD
ncbi:hypothetical protein D3C86_1999020 [compost metagenome]